MIRVLNILGSLQCAGAETTTMNYYRNIDRTKIQFDFLIVGNNGKNYYEDEAISLGARVFRWHTKEMNWPKSLKELILILKTNPDIKIVHIHSYKPQIAIYSSIAMLCAVKVRIAHSRNTMPKMPLVQKLFQPLLRATATHWLGCSTEAVMSMFGLKSGENRKITVLKNARDLKPFKYNTKRRNAVREDMGINGCFVLLNVGRLHEQKNQGFLLEAFALALKKYPESVLLIAGEGHLRAELTKRIAELRLEDSVRLLGRRDDIPDLLQASDVFVFPSLYEGLGTVSIEAQAAGLPCLISDTVTTECKVTDSVEFLPIDKGPECWVDKIAEYRSFERRDTMEDVCRSGYDITLAAKKLERLYLNALKEKER